MKNHYKSPPHFKAANNIPAILIFSLGLSFCQISCRTMEKTSVPCPEISIKKNRQLTYHRVNKKKNPYDQKKKSRLVAQNNYRFSEIKKTGNGPGIPAASVVAEKVPEPGRLEYTKGLIASADPDYIAVSGLILTPEFNTNVTDGPGVPINARSVECDSIFLRTGSILTGKVEEIGQVEIKYRKCNNLTGPLISVLKSDVSSIHYSNGTREFFDPSEVYIPKRPVPVKSNNTVLITEGLGLAGFITSLAGLVVAGILFGTVAIVLGGISLSRIRKNPQKYKGKGFAKAGIIIGIIEILVMVIFLASV